MSVLRADGSGNLSYHGGEKYGQQFFDNSNNAYKQYKKTADKIKGEDTTDSISLHWDGNKDKWKGSNEETGFSTLDNYKPEHRNIFEKKNESAGNAGIFYLVARESGASKYHSEPDGDYRTYKTEIGFTKTKPTFANSNKGIWMEVNTLSGSHSLGDRNGWHNLQKDWKKLAERHLMGLDDENDCCVPRPGAEWISSYKDIKYRKRNRSIGDIRDLARSGMRVEYGNRSGQLQWGAIMNLDTGRREGLWPKTGFSRVKKNITDASGWTRSSARDSVMGRTYMKGVEDQVNAGFNVHKNKIAENISDKNKKLNKENTAKNNLYDKVKTNLTNATKGGDYVKQRDKLTKDDLVAAGISNKVANKILNKVKNVYKDYYRDQHLHKWDNSLGAKPEYGSFNASYYSDNNAVARDKYNEAVANDDIDLTEGYGRNNYMWWHYTTVGKDAGARGNEAEVLNMASEYLEEAPDIQEGGWENQTDADVMAVRDKQLGIVDEDIDMVNDVPEIKAAWEEAKAARAAGDEDNYWVNLAGKNYLKVTEPEQFAYLYKISARDNEEHKKVMDSLIGTGAGITDLEDRITESVGTQNLLNVERFGALNQNILKETINEIKRAKVKEQEMAMFRNFGQFNEVLNINETLSNSILGDSGIGGYLAITGDDDFDQDKLERKLSGITGVNNNVVHNWEKWFDEKIQQKYNDDIELGYTVDDAERNIAIQKEFAEDYVNSYLKPRFDESRSMSEFVEYLDVRQEEQNPFQTQDILNAVQQVGQSHADSYLDQLRLASDKDFDSTFYTDPTGKAGLNEAREADYTRQRDMVAADWNNAKNNPDELVDPLNPGLGTWREQAYRFGTDVTNADQFARLHYQIKGQHGNYKFDGAEDIMSPGKVKDYIYTTIFPALQNEVKRQPHVFGQFIRPEEFADDVLEGIDPNVPDSWESALTGSDGKSLIEGFTGSFDELKQYIVDGMSGNSALDMRQSIKYLNEKKERPTQELLGIDYIQRDEDYNPADTLKGDTQLYKIFQGAGYEGTEDDFYDKVFPDLDPSSQELLSQAGSKDGKITLGSWDASDPYAALGSVDKLLGDDFGSSTKKSTTDKEDKKSSVFNFDPFADDDEDDDYKSTKGQEILSDFTKGFKFF